VGETVEISIGFDLIRWHPYVTTGRARAARSPTPAVGRIASMPPDPHRSTAHPAEPICRAGTGYLTRAPKERIKAVWDVVAGIPLYDHDAAAGHGQPHSKGRASQGRQIES
jgi:hypothetical protein